MVRNPSRVPADYPRSKIENYFMVVYVIRQGDGDYSDKRQALNGLLAMHEETNNFAFKARLASVLAEWEIKVAA